ncbi:MAG: AMP-binding protein [Gammaproteobacteria bacterium]|nr:AMP-binding protein [Gammaproteobacteria bacterium]
MPNSHLQTLVEILQEKASQDPQKIIYRWVHFDKTESLTYAELDHQAKQFATELQTNYKDNRTAIIALTPSIHYLIALFGCFYANVIAIPHHPAKNQRQTKLTKAIIKDTAAMIITHEKHATQYSTSKLIIEDIIASAERYQPQKFKPDTTAYLQYTSGSTREPHGIMISHKNIIANCEAIRLNYDTDKRIICSWLPPHHDMGLVGAIFCAIYGDRECILMQPLDFVRKPLFWLETVNRYRASATLASNFSLELCNKKLKKLTAPMDLDLSCLETIIIGSEPIHQKILDEFTELTKPYRFNPTALSPAYGLAEATLLISATHQHQKLSGINIDPEAFKQNQIKLSNKPHATHLISVGEAVKDHKIIIVDPTSHAELAANQIGEIWVAGPSIAKGYWQNTELSQKIFQNKMGNKTYLKTGDYGFKDKNNKLYITGRSEELIIINGQNFYAHDIEYCLETSHPAINSDGCIIFTSKKMNSDIIAVIEIDRHDKNHDAIHTTAADKLWEAFNLNLKQINLIPQGFLPRTSSHKKRRNKCRELWQNKNLKIIFSS